MSVYVDTLWVVFVCEWESEKASEVGEDAPTTTPCTNRKLRAAFSKHQQDVSTISRLQLLLSQLRGLKPFRLLWFRKTSRLPNKYTISLNSLQTETQENQIQPNPDSWLNYSQSASRWWTTKIARLKKTFIRRKAKVIKETTFPPLVCFCLKSATK